MKVKYICGKQGSAKRSITSMLFTEFLLEKCWVKYGQFYKDREEFNEHYEKGEVTIEISHVHKLYDEFLEQNPQLPSRFKHGDKVILDFDQAGKITNATVIKVHFSESKVLYDVEIQTKPNIAKYTRTPGESNAEYTRLYNIDSCFVHPA